MSQKTERVVVTGMGVASPLGCNLNEFWDGLIAGCAGVGFLNGEAFSDLPHTIHDIDYINAHATGTEWNDKNETRAIKEVFGGRADEIPVVGNKAALGHSIAGSGALELIGCVLSLRDQVVPPTINYKVPDPECDLDSLIEGSRKVRLKNIMSNSFAFGGSNAVWIVGKYEPSN